MPATESNVSASVIWELVIDFECPRTHDTVNVVVRRWFHESALKLFYVWVPTARLNPRISHGHPFLSNCERNPLNGGGTILTALCIRSLGL